MAPPSPTVPLVPEVVPLVPDVPPDVCGVVANLLQKRPRDRFQSGKELAGELARLYDALRVQERQQARREDSNSLRRLRFFDRFSESEIEEVLNPSTLTQHAAGSVIVQEGALAEARMRDREAGFVDASVSIQQDVEIDHARSPSRAVALAALLALDREQRIEQITRSEPGRDFDGGVDESRLVDTPPRRRAEPARRAQPSRARTP